MQCAAVPASHADRRGTMSSMTSASSSNLRYLASDHTANLRPSRSIGHFPSPPARTSRATPNNFDASPPLSPTDPAPASLGRTRMNSKTWRDDELPGLITAYIHPSTSISRQIGTSTDSIQTTQELDPC